MSCRNLLHCPHRLLFSIANGVFPQEQHKNNIEITKDKDTNEKGKNLNKIDKDRIPSESMEGKKKENLPKTRHEYTSYWDQVLHHENGNGNQVYQQKEHGESKMKEKFRKSRTLFVSSWDKQRK